MATEASMISMTSQPTRADPETAKLIASAVAPVLEEILCVDETPPGAKLDAGASSSSACFDEPTIEGPLVDAETDEFAEEIVECQGSQANSAQLSQARPQSRGGASSSAGERSSSKRTSQVSSGTAVLSTPGASPAERMMLKTDMFAVSLNL